MPRIGMLVPAAGLLCALTIAPAAMSQTFESRRIVANDAGAGDAYGWSVAVSGDLAVIGAMFDDADTGSVYVVDVTTGQQLKKLTASDGHGGDLFGYSVALDGTTAVIGAIWNDGGATGGGAAYVFDVVTGAELWKLLADDATPNDRLGISVAIEGDTILVGAPEDDWAGSASGSVYVFDRVTGAQTAKLTAVDTQPSDLFGQAVALSGTTALIGAPGDSASGDASGMAYVFDLTTGSEVVQFQPADVAAFDVFSRGLDLEGDIAVIGSETDDDDGVNSGSAYIFNITTQQQLAKLAPSDPQMLGFFGSKIAIHGDQVLIGQWFGVTPGSSQGRAYLFDIPSATETAALRASDGLDNDLFGAAVGLSSSAAVVGAYAVDHGGLFDPGAAYVFDLADCLADLTGDGVVDSGDLGVFITAFLGGDLMVDFTGDGIVDSGDLGVFIDHFLAGC